MDISAIKTLGDLQKSGYQEKGIKDELRTNLMAKLQNNAPIFEGIIGYEDTVIPQLCSAILAKHNINLLGLRGQAKTRIARSFINLLDEYMPIVEGSEINDSPFNPISTYAQTLVAEKQENTPISWVHRSERFYEKLATPDVSVADLIGDVDPIKAANLKLSYADEKVIHFGMIPRANRCIFVINELPDLQARIQVSLFNILQEGDIQIRGFQIRMPLEHQFIFTANPEDYTNRGSIVTPLKDRIGSQILTHYPKTLAIAKQITQQEFTNNNANVTVPEIAKDLVEQIGFEARTSEFIDVKSGISARMGITAFENLIATAELRLLNGTDKTTAIRMTDFLGITPAITGKVELVYEGEQEGAEKVAQSLVGAAVKTLFNQKFTEIQKLQKPGTKGQFDSVIEWFTENGSFDLPINASNQLYQQQLEQVTPLKEIVTEFQPNASASDQLFLMELLLWGLAEYKKLDKRQRDNGFMFDDTLLSSIR